MYEEIKSCGANLVAISPQQAKYSKKINKKLNLTFPILADADNSVASLFGLTFTLPEELKSLYIEFGIDLPRFNGNDSWQLPIASIFIADKKGIIRNVEAHPDYTRRPEPSEIVAFLKWLSIDKKPTVEWWFK